MNSDVQLLWEECLKLSLLGAQRQTTVPSADDAPEPVRQLLADLYAGGVPVPEKRGAALLQLSGALSAYQGAGCQAPLLAHAKSIGDAQPMPERTLPVTLLYTLQHIINNAHLEALLPEWLSLARKAGIAAPPEALPELLEAGAKRDDLKPLLPLLLGSRGRWLAQFEPHWALLLQQVYIASSMQLPDDSVWEEGALVLRVSYLKQLRMQNAEQGRELLISVWKMENARARSHLLAAFSEGLNSADEAFLEQALTDRAKAVRVLASRFLVMLPNSAHLQRLKALADNSLELIVEEKRSLLGK